MRPSPSSAIETSTPAIRNLWRSACVLPPFIYLFICPPNLRHSSRARCIQRNLSSKFLCRWIIVGRRKGKTVIGELHSFHLQRIKLRKISLLVLLWREACNYSANFRQIYSFSRLGVYATLLWDNFLLEFDNKVSNFSLGKFSLSRNIDIWLDVAAFFASLTRWNLWFGLNFFFL